MTSSMVQKLWALRDLYVICAKILCHKRNMITNSNNGLINIRRYGMPNYDWECKNGHQFEQITEWDRKSIKCPKCKTKSERVWLSPRSPHSQFQTPIVMWRYADGSLGVAGGADSKTPRNAERVEIRSGSEYRRYAGELNKQRRGKEQLKEERYQEVKEAMEKQAHSNLNTLMANERDPYARDLYREALARSSGGHSQLPYSDFYSVVMENDRSNYE